MASESEGIPFETVFQKSLNAISVHTVVLDADGSPVDYVFDAVNQGFETLTGLAAADVLGRRVREVLPGTEPIWIERYGQVALTGEPQQFSSYSQELGKWFEVSAFQHKPGGFTATFVDSTAQHLNEEALRESEQRLARVLEGSQLGYWDWDIPTGKVQRNRRWAEMLGYTLEEIEFTVRQWSDLQHPEDRERAWKSISDHLEGRTEQHRIEYRMRCKDGSYRWILDQAAVVRRDAGGRPLQMSGTHTDITERRLAELEKNRLQAQLQQSQKMQNLGSLAGGVAHDMNNVLASILTLASAQMLRLPEGDPLRRTFHTMSQAAQRGGALVKSLLEFARQTPAEVKPLDLNALIAADTPLLERTTLARVEVRTELDPELPLVQGDAGALSHALMNLCINAVDAMPRGGVLTLRSRRDGDHVVVEVQDTGVGMTPDVRERALDPFFTTKPVGKGTGLGLSLVYSTVQAHGGTLELVSRHGEGCLVRLQFPAAPDLTHAPMPAVPERRAPTASLSILVVDDDELVRDSLREILEALGHRADFADRGEEALHRLRSQARPQVVILDVNMPGSGGAETLDRLRRLEPTLPVILSTGRPDQAALDLVGRHPFVSLLAKPYTCEDLERVLSDIRPMDGQRPA